MLKKQINNEFLTCPVCEGSGKGKHGLACSNCGGMGLGTFSHGRFFYWGLKLGRAVIELDHLRKKFHLALNLISYAIGLIGLLALGGWVYLASEYTIELGAFAFWREKHILILIFWLSIIADMFIIYRFSEEERRSFKIRQFKYEERNKKVDLPNNWDELRKLKTKYKIDVVGGFDQQALAVVEKAYILADKLKHSYVTPIHLFFASLSDQQVAAIFSRLNVDSRKLLEKLKERITKITKSEKKTKLSGSLKEVLIQAYLAASNLGQKKVTAKNFIIPCLGKDKILKEILYDFEVEKNKIFNVILWFIINEKLIENYRIYRKKARFKPSSNMDRAYTAVATPTLSHFGYDLTVAAKWGRLEYCVAREEETEKIWQNFESGNMGVVLVGPAGVGKNTVIDGIAQLMVKEDVPRSLKDKRLVELDVARLVSGVTPAQAEERMLVVVDEVVRSGNIVLFIDNIENLMGITSGTEESLDLSEVLVGSLERKDFYCLASVTNENYIKYIEGKPLGNVMAKVEIKEPLDNQAIQIIESKIGHLEGKYKVYFSYNAIAEVVKLSQRYIHDKYLPQKAINILELVAVKVAKSKGEQSIVSKEDIAAAVSEVTNIPVTKVTETESQNLLKLEELIHKRMINQEEAVKVVAASLRRARAQLREGKRPIANFLFLGPTGVGKTELAKTVAEIYFSSEKRMVRLDMSEYQHPDSVKKMIGDASGTLGYLTEAVRKSPFSLVLLDEFEKAHPDILNLFLQVMDDGRLTDGQGRTIDFTSSIIIATSNAGALYIQKQIFAGTSMEEIKQTLINEYLNKVMRPELINRFDGVIVFEPLSMENVVEIAKLMLAKTKQMLEAKGIGLELEEEGVRKLAILGFDSKFGARPLRRLLQKKVEDVIANKILAGDLVRRDTVVINTEAIIQVEKGREL